MQAAGQETRPTATHRRGPARRPPPLPRGPRRSPATPSPRRGGRRSAAAATAAAAVRRPTAGHDRRPTARPRDRRATGAAAADRRPPDDERRHRVACVHPRRPAGAARRRCSACVRYGARLQRRPAADQVDRARRDRTSPSPRPRSTQGPPASRSTRTTSQQRQPSAEDIVFDQDPAAGTKVDKGTDGQARRSARAPAQVDVPNVVGKTSRRRPAPRSTRRPQRSGRDRARPTTRAVGARSSRRTRRRQRRPTRARPSRSPCRRARAGPVPDVAGKDPTDAANQLGAAGLQGHHGDPGGVDHSRRGKVIRTDPPAGTAVDKGSR